MHNTTSLRFINKIVSLSTTDSLSTRHVQHKNTFMNTHVHTMHSEGTLIVRTNFHTVFYVHTVTTESSAENLRTHLVVLLVQEVRFRW